MAVVRARGTFHYGEHGMLHEGDLWDAEDPVVRDHPEWFDDDLDSAAKRSVPREAPVEQATAAPGEKRPTRRR